MSNFDEYHGKPENLKINKKEIARFKKEYKKAKNNNAESFIFQGKEVITNYAKYLIQYLENEL